MRKNIHGLSEYFFSFKLLRSHTSAYIRQHTGQNRKDFDVQLDLLHEEQLKCEKIFTASVNIFSHLSCSDLILRHTFGNILAKIGKILTCNWICCTKSNSNAKKYSRSQ